MGKANLHRKNTKGQRVFSRKNIWVITFQIFAYASGSIIYDGDPNNRTSNGIMAVGVMKASFNQSSFIGDSTGRNTLYTDGRILFADNGAPAMYFTLAAAIYSLIHKRNQVLKDGKQLKED